jgi:hypothetical protein
VTSVRFAVPLAGVRRGMENQEEELGKENVL